MACKTAYFNGWGECNALLNKMNGAALQSKGNTWTDATAVTVGSWHTAIADDDSDVRDTLMLPVLSFENTTDDIEILTSPLGKKSKGDDPTPSGVVYLDASLCDYKYLHDLQGISFEFIPFFQGGSFWMTRKSDGTLKGFRCSLATKAGLPPEDKNMSYPLYIFFDEYSEFEDVVQFSDFDFNYSDLQDFSPVGVNIRVSTAYTGGDVIIYAEKRGTGEPMTGLDQTTDWEIMKSNATPTVAVTVVSESGLGYYTLTIKKDSGGTPANLAAGDYVYLQAHDVDSTPTYITYLSNAIKFNGGT